MEKLLKNRFFKYLVDHYSRMPEIALTECIEIAKNRVVDTGLFSADVLNSVIEEMRQEGTTAAAIMAHLDLLDLDERT